VNGGKWRQEKHLDIFGHQSCIFYTALRLLQALVITYDEIFQALAVTTAALLPKLFLDLCFDDVVRRKS
jgi:hypothetical protein